ALKGIEAAGEVDPAHCSPVERSGIRAGIALLPSDRHEQRVEPDEAVGRESEAHPARMWRRPAERSPAGRARALPFGVRGIHADDAVAHAATAEQAVQRPLADAAP